MWLLIGASECEGIISYLAFFVHLVFNHMRQSESTCRGVQIESSPNNATAQRQLNVVRYRGLARIGFCLRARLRRLWRAHSRRSPAAVRALP